MINFENCIPTISERLKAHNIIFPYMGVRKARPKGWKSIIVFTQYGNDKSFINPSFSHISKEIDIHGLERFSMQNWALYIKDITHINSEEELIEYVINGILKMKEVNHA